MCGPVISREEFALVSDDIFVDIDVDDIVAEICEAGGDSCADVAAADD